MSTRRSDTFLVGETTLALERASLEIAERLLAASPEEDSFAAAIRDVLRLAGEFCGADRAYVFALEPRREGSGFSGFRLLHAWDAPGVAEPLSGADLELPAERAPWTLASVVAGRALREPSRSRTAAAETETERDLMDRFGLAAALALPIPDRAGGPPFGVAGFASDTPKRAWSKQSRDLLVRMSQTLGDAMARQREWTEERAARRAAEREAKARVEFAARVSHEIRTPLNGVIGMADMLLGSGLAPEQRDLAETVRVSGEALLSVVNDVLDYSKLEAGKTELERLPLDLRELFEEVADILRPRAAEADAKLVISLERGMATHLEGDGPRLRQVLLNLADNALKHARGGAVTLRARRERGGSSAKNIRVLFEVSDTGIGIPPEAIERLFRPYEQLDAATARVSGGTGLGLAIARGIARAMGGELRAESEPGKGSRFWFSAEFPLVQRTGVTETTRRRHRAGGIRVLLADPSETAGEALADQLAAWSCEAEVVNSGGAALERLREAAVDDRPFQLALLDEDLVEPNPSELVARARADSSLAATRYLLLVGRVASVAAGARLEEGFVRRLLKPVRQAKLFEAMAVALGFWTSSLAGLESTQSRLLERRLAARKPRGAKRVLVVEDNQLNQKVAIRLLRDANYECEIAENGAEGLKRLESERFDAVLMDCQMPVMDGWEAARRLRALESEGKRSGRLPIVAMTANALEQDRERCLAAGMDEYVAKPIRRVTLLAAMDRALAGVDDSDPSTPATLPSLARLAVMGDGPPIDRDVVREVSDGDPEFEREMYDLFLAHQPPRLAALERAAATGDLRLAKTEAHAARGAALNVGARRLAELAAMAEAAADAGDLPAVATTARDMVGEFDRARSFLGDMPAT